MKFPWEQKSKLRAAKWWRSPLLLVAAWLCFIIIIDWEIWVHFVAFAALIVLLWWFFGEPHTLRIQNRYFDLPCKAKVALISDLHLWIYKRQAFLDKVIRKINQHDVDYLFIAWDLTYYPKRHKLDELFAPLSKSRVPVYAVLWNHDVEKPGHPIRNELISALRKANVTFLNNTIVELDGFLLVGLWEHRSHEDNVAILKNIHSSLPIVVLTHNPATIKKYTHLHQVSLTICGHTHGWQIRLPFLEKWLWIFSSFVKHNSRWHLQHQEHKYFITSWVGEVWLPARFFSPPTIDILSFWEQKISRKKRITQNIKKWQKRIQKTS